MVRERTSRPTGFFAYPPVTDAHVAWVAKNLPVLKAMTTLPAVTTEHRNHVAVHLANLFLLYASTAIMSPDQQKQEGARRKIVADAFLKDLSNYPEWAVIEGIEAYRKGPHSGFAPKAPGQILIHIQEAMGRAQAALLAAERVELANAKGRNIDSLVVQLTEAEKKGEREHAELALQIMESLPKWCDIHADPAAKALSDKCFNTFHAWRKKNPLNKGAQ